MSADAYLDRLRAFAEEMRPDAELMDTDAALVARRYARFWEEGLHTGWSVRQPLSGREFCDALAILGGVSGAFGFVVLQQFVANLSLSARISDEADWPTVGVAFGHLRNPAGTAPRLQNGLANGFVPWLTGAGIFTHVILGLRAADGQEIYALVEANDRREFRHSAPLPLIACSGTNTVTVEIENLFIADSEILRSDPPGTLATGDANGVLYQTPLMVGCVQACGDIIAVSPRLPAETRARCAQAIADITGRIAAAFEGGSPDEGRQLRAELGDFSVRLARLATMAAGGAGLTAGHPAQRLYREALVYSLMAQTDAIVQQAFAEVFP